MFFRWLLIPFFVLIAFRSICQRPPIDGAAVRGWPFVFFSGISNGGRYAAYTTGSRYYNTDTLIVKELEGSWSIRLPNAKGIVFSEDEKWMVFRKGADSLGILTLGGSGVEYIAGVSSFKLSSSGWLLYTGAQGMLRMRKPADARGQIFRDVRVFFVSPGGDYLVLQRSLKNGDGAFEQLECVDLVNLRDSVVWMGKKCSNFVFDREGKQFAFIGEDRKLWRYDLRGGLTGLGTDTADGWELDNISRFSNDGGRVFVYFKPVATEHTGVDVNVWSYADDIIQSEQRVLAPQRRLLAVWDPGANRITRLERNGDEVWGQLSDQRQDSLILVLHMDGDKNEMTWNPKAKGSVALVSVKGGRRKEIREDIRNLSLFSYELSHEGRYIIYYDPVLKNWMSYEVSTGIIRNITKGIRGQWTGYKYVHENANLYSPIGCAGWLQGDSALLLYELNDIWLVYPDGRLPPENLTHSEDYKGDLVFRLAFDHRGSAVKHQERLVLVAFDRESKDNGFFSKAIGKAGRPERLTMGPYYFSIPLAEFGFPTEQIKRARDAEVYVLKRCSATAAPNLFFTQDFRQFHAISGVYPEKEYNWLTANLEKWRGLDGDLIQGVLYRPENFDPLKKYPLIFYYYDHLSDRLNQFLTPEFSDGIMNIPWFVSNGYLVVTPDIHYKMGQPGKSVVNALVSAAGYFSSKAWVDKKRLGVQGHSFGGFETNYLITRTNLFAAACGASGMTDLVSVAYGSLWKRIGVSEQEYYYSRDGRLGTDLWRSRETYINNSPIFFADRIKTPLLMVNNPKDEAVPFEQGLELYNSLRYLNKKVWMLEYENAYHSLSGKDAEDFTVRLDQFFDHYLKGKEVPGWMTKSTKLTP